MYREPAAEAPDELLTFLIRTKPEGGFTTDTGTKQALADLQHMHERVNERLAQGFWVRKLETCALDADHAMVIFVLARIQS
jgi:hypothetical protein